MRRRGTRSRSGSLAALAVPFALVAGALSGCAGAGAATSAPARVAGPPAECPGVLTAADAPQRQVRGMWISTVSNGDWPPEGASPAQQQAAYVKLLDAAVAMNLNTVFVQVRPTSDAFYASPYEPWSQWLTGTAGKDPGWDVLGFLVSQAHQRGLAFHAWFNPYRVSVDSDRSALAPGSPARQHPSWVVSYGGELWYDPGLPQVRQLVTNVVDDVVRRYDVDGVHLDDYFYPYPAGGDFPDDASFKAYGKGMSRAAWRRQNVDQLVQGLSQSVHGLKPWVQFGISPFGVWRNSSSDKAGSATHALQSYDDIYADSLGWVRRGWLDYVVPQLYWTIGDPRADYATLARWWANAVQGTSTQLWIGQGAYQVGTDGAWRKPGELAGHLALDATLPQVRGEVFFSASDVVHNVSGWASLVRAQRFARPALAPPSPVRGGSAPVAPVKVRTARGSSGVSVSWQASGASSYAVYRADGSQAGCAPTVAGDLVATVRTVSAAGERVSVVDTGARPGATYTYSVTAVDRLGRQSGPARGSVIVAGHG